MRQKLKNLFFASLITVGVGMQSQGLTSLLAASPVRPVPTMQIPLPQQTSAEIRVQLGKSLLITSEDQLQRVSVTDPTVAAAVIVSPTQVLIHGLKPGAQTLILLIL